MLYYISSYNYYTVIIFTVTIQFCGNRVPAQISLRFTRYCAARSPLRNPSSANTFIFTFTFIHLYAPPHRASPLTTTQQHNHQ